MADQNWDTGSAGDDDVAGQAWTTGTTFGPRLTTFRRTSSSARRQVRSALELKDFTVYEDLQQNITNFLKFIGGRALGSVADVAAPVTPAAEGIILPRTKPAADSSGRIFIIFIDDMHLQALDTPRVKDTLKIIRDNLIHENDLVGFVSSGYSSIQIDVSYDYNHRRFDEAISNR